MREKIIELYAEDPDRPLLFADGFDEAIIGICPHSLRVVYLRSKCVEILMKEDDMSEVDAIDYLEYNTFNAYVGENTPIWVDDLSETL